MSANVLAGRISPSQRPNDADEELVSYQKKMVINISNSRGELDDLGIENLKIKGDSVHVAPMHSPRSEPGRKSAQEKVKLIRSILKNGIASIVKDHPRSTKTVSFALSPIFITDKEKSDKGVSNSNADASMGSMDIFCALDENSKRMEELANDESSSSDMMTSAEKREMFASDSQVFELDEEDLWNSTTSW
mmetsp:Transcript_27388/g.41459  ORF Transcript_27388/g.41459 Transcript_27388/m.41459 type:complete len:191 (+) Transcript_27388:148-720(+)